MVPSPKVIVFLLCYLKFKVLIMSDIEMNASTAHGNDSVHQENMSTSSDITSTENSAKDNVSMQALLKILTLQDEKIRILQEQVTRNISNGSTDNNKLSVEKLRHRFVEQVKNYSGERINDPKSKFKEWKDSIETYCAVYSDSIPDDKFVIELIKLRVKGKAKDWYSRHEGSFESVQDVLSKIEKQFGVANPLIEFATRCERYNKDNKSLHQIYNDFQELADSLDGSIPEEALTIEFFRRIPKGISGYIRNQKVPRDVTWGQLYEMAVAFEDTYEESKEKQKNKADGKVGKSYKSGSKGAFRCYKCKKPGHIASSCPSKGGEKN